MLWSFGPSRNKLIFLSPGPQTKVPDSVESRDARRSALPRKLLTTTVCSHPHRGNGSKGATVENAKMVRALRERNCLIYSTPVQNCTDTTPDAVITCLHFADRSSRGGNPVPCRSPDVDGVYDPTDVRLLGGVVVLRTPETPATPPAYRDAAQQPIY